MRKVLIILALVLSCLACFAQQVNTDIIPASPGLKLGHSNQRWDTFFRNVDISGTCLINGVPCGSGTGGGGSGCVVNPSDGGCALAGVPTIDFFIGAVGAGTGWLVQLQAAGLNVKTPVNISGTTAGILTLGCGPDPGVGSGIAFTSPTSCTPYTIYMPSNSASGFWKGSNTANKLTMAFQAGIDLTQDVTGVLPLLNGGTGNSTQSGALVALFPNFIRNGDLCCFWNGSAWINLGGNSSAGGTVGFVTENSGGSWSWTVSPLGTPVGGTGLSTRAVGRIYEGNGTGAEIASPLLENGANVETTKPFKLIGSTSLTGPTLGADPNATAYAINFPINAGGAGDCLKYGTPFTFGACGGSAAFSAITPGTNTGALVMGTSGSLSPTGSGQVAGTQNWFLGGIIDPVVTVSATGGSLPANTNIGVQISYNTALGESVPSRLFSISTPGGCGTSCSATVVAPTLPFWATAYTVYSCQGVSCTTVLKQAVSSNCVAITGSCLIQIPGAGSAPLTIQTAFVQPPNVQATSCPPSLIPTMFIGDSSGNYQTQAGVDPFFDASGGPTSPGGTLTFCRRTWFNDTGASPPAGKNALVNIRHRYATGTTLTNQDRALSIVADNGTTDTSTHYGLEAIQAELDLQGAPTAINGSPDGEVAVASFQLSDTHTNNFVAPPFGVTAMRITTFRNGAGLIGSCNYCLSGANIFVSNLSATSFSGGFMSGIELTMNDTGPSPNASSVGIHINAPPFRFINFNRSLQVDNTGTNLKDFNIYSVGSGTGGRNFFGGNLYVPNIITAAADIGVTGSMVASGSVSTAQFATPAFNNGNVVVNGTTGATTWSYKLTAVDGNGRESAASVVGTTATGNATLTGANFNQINLSGGAFVIGVGRYNVYRTAAGGTPSTTGKIGTITTSSTVSPAQGLAPADIFNDTGQAGDGSTPPTANTSGGVLAAGYVTAGLNTIRVASDFTTAANTNLQTITGLTWNLPTATAKYSFHCALAYSQATANVAVAFGIQSATQAATNIFATGQIQTNTTAFSASTLATLASTTATNIVSATPGAIATNFTAYLDGTIEEPAGTGNAINIMVSTANSGDLVTVLRGSFCSVQP